MPTKTEVAVNIGLSEKQRAGAGDLLGRALADAHVLYVRARNYHWNVVGPDFQELHDFFEKQYTSVAEEIDDIAERIRALGLPAPGTMTEFLRTASLKEYPGDYPDSEGMLENLLADHEAMIRFLREAVDRSAEELHDTGTSDFLTGLMEDHEKTAWMIRAYLERR